MRLRTSFSEEITQGGRAVGDVLSLGIELQHRYGSLLEVYLYVERLICLNGMVSNRKEFEWKQALTGNNIEQLEWVKTGISQAVLEWPNIITRSRRMAATPLGGNPERAVAERASAMGLRTAQVMQVIEAFRQEPITTEWGALNAITHWATHSPKITREQQNRVQAAAGNWISVFDLVNARLPRPMAEAIGATIIEERTAAE
jgi:heme-degrading monooxygenase HmoA